MGQSDPASAKRHEGVSHLAKRAAALAASVRARPLPVKRGKKGRASLPLEAVPDRFVVRKFLFQLLPQIQDPDRAMITEALHQPSRLEELFARGIRYGHRSGYRVAAITPRYLIFFRSVGRQVYVMELLHEYIFARFPRRRPPQTPQVKSPRPPSHQPPAKAKPVKGGKKPTVGPNPPPSRPSAMQKERLGRWTSTGGGSLPISPENAGRDWWRESGE